MNFEAGAALGTVAPPPPPPQLLSAAGFDAASPLEGSCGPPAAWPAGGGEGPKDEEAAADGFFTLAGSLGMAFATAGVCSSVAVDCSGILAPSAAAMARPIAEISQQMRGECG